MQTPLPPHTQGDHRLLTGLGVGERFLQSGQSQAGPKGREPGWARGRQWGPFPSGGGEAPLLALFLLLLPPARCQKGQPPPLPRLPEGSLEGRRLRRCLGRRQAPGGGTRRLVGRQPPPGPQDSGRPPPRVPRSSPAGRSGLESCGGLGLGDRGFPGRGPPVGIRTRAPPLTCRRPLDAPPLSVRRPRCFRPRPRRRLRHRGRC